jgi:hypothetical protein
MELPHHDIKEVTAMHCTCEISSSHGGEYDVQNCLLMMEAVRTSEMSVDNYFTRQYIPEDNSEHNTLYSLNPYKVV